jgi:hypothetical protein
MCSSTPKLSRIVTTGAKLCAAVLNGSGFTADGSDWDTTGPRPVLLDMTPCHSRSQLGHSHHTRFPLAYDTASV